MRKLTVAAGALRMPRANFLVGAAAASILWAAIYYWLGYALGAGVTRVIGAAAGRAFHDPEVAAAGGVVVGSGRLRRAEGRSRRIPARRTGPQQIGADDVGLRSECTPRNARGGGKNSGNGSVGVQHDSWLGQ